MFPDRFIHFPILTGSVRAHCRWHGTAYGEYMQHSVAAEWGTRVRAFPDLTYASVKNYVYGTIG